MVIWCLSPVTPLTPLPLISHLNNWQWDGIRSVRTHATQDGVRHSNKVLDTLTDTLQSTAALWLHNIIRIPYPESVNIYSIKISGESVSSVSLWARRVCQNHNHLHAKMQLIPISGNKLEKIKTKQYQGVEEDITHKLHERQHETWKWRLVLIIEHSSIYGVLL